ncbi:MAG: hypothetical protein R3F62_24230 [Planctomycetota bacterium]
MARLLTSLLLLALCASPLVAEELVEGERDLASVAKGVELLLSMEEGEAQGEWPYEGVYRVGGQIPIGYRVGGTAIVSLALLEAPGLEADTQRQEALTRAARFVVGAVKHPLMQHSFSATYDVRGWGFAYGAQFLARLVKADRVPAELQETLPAAIGFYVKGIAATEIPRYGGWNYSRRSGFDRPGPQSPFMTGSTLQALFEVKAAGFEVEPGLVTRGLKALEYCRAENGAYVYAGIPSRGDPGLIPGAMGRMLVAESTLWLAGKGDEPRLEAALQAFFNHWDELDKRRAQNGTHVQPYGVAPYYFYYAHRYAAQAIELLPEAKRAAYRTQLREKLYGVQLEDGRWNDRVFPRTANFGTAFSVLALLEPQATRPATWTVEEPAEEQEEPAADDAR